MLIGINGAKGAGKDTVGSHLVSKHGFVRVGFADALKESAAALFDINPAVWDVGKNDPLAKIALVQDDEIGKEITVREFLQRYGTESHRDVFGDNFWVDHAIDRIRGLIEDGKNVVVTDMRFPNELDAIMEQGGVLWKVRRPDVEGGDGHASEQVISDEEFDFVFWNTGSIDALLRNIDVVIDEEFAITP